MSFPLRQVVEIVAVVVWVRHIAGAARTFRLPPGERPSPTIYFFTIATMILAYRVFNAPLERRLTIPGLAFFVASLTLFEWARYTVRGKFFSYIYSDDTPQFICTSGPYAYIRNPFYTSYILSYIGAAMMFPGWIAYIVVAAMIVYFLSAARYEEGKFRRSPLAADYEAYRRRTGRFIPRLGSA
jgi:protein-S-isoprenylcysteine O-methyltransferase Ste14